MFNNRFAIVGLCAASVSGIAFAETATGVLPVTATVENACSVGTEAVVFDNVATDAVDATGKVTVQCTNSGPFTVALDGGENGDISARTLSHETLSESFTYQLYTDALRTTVWGDGTTGIPQAGVGPLQEFDVYGRTTSVPEAAGDYDDFVNVTVTF